MYRLCILMLLAPMARPLSAQSRTTDVDVTAGVAVTSGLFSVNGGTGPIVRLGLLSRTSTSHIGYRLDVEAFSIATRTIPRGAIAPAGGYSDSVVYSVLAGATRDGLVPYVIGGLGVQFASSRETDSFPGLWASIRFGAGVRRKVRDVELTAEIAAVGAMRRFRGGAYWPLTVGIAF